MHPRRPQSWPALNICWKCQWRMNIQHRTLGLPASARNAIALGRRTLHATQLRPQPTIAAANIPSSFDPALLQAHSLPIRERLQLKQEELGGPDEETLKAFGNYPTGDAMINGFSTLSYSAKADEGSCGAVEENEDDDGDELITIGLFLKPGDVVELSQPGREPVLAVFVQQLELMSQFYSVNGRWCHSRLIDVSFAIPGGIDHAKVQSLLPYMPTDLDKASPKGDIHVPRHLGAPVIEILEHMAAEAERIYRKNAPVLDTAYSILADKKRTRMMTLKQIAKILLGKTDRNWEPSPAALLAVRKALYHNQFRFGSDNRSQRLTNVFSIRPTDDVQAIETVLDWVREYNEKKAVEVANGTDSHSTSQVQSKGADNIAEFIDKARRLIAISRQHRDPNPGFVGPSKEKRLEVNKPAALRTTFGEQFTDADKQIITFLQAWVLQGQFVKMSSFYASCIAIIQATQSYEGSIVNLPRPEMEDPHRERIDLFTGHLFLQEIGVLTPHEDRTIYDEQLMLPSVRLSRNLELLITKAELTRRNPDFRDSMAHLRRDWGATTVYCIDNLDALEIDDGVSIEKVPDNDSEYWVHVHVANPTAFFNKTHVLSGLAAHMTESVYTPQRSYPMLPDWATQNHFSLDRDRPVLTFSSRIDTSGNVLETEIQPGIIRKVISLTPAEVSAYLGEGIKVVEKRTIVVGGEVSPALKDRPRPNLSAEEIKELRNMYIASQAVWKKRKAAGGIKIGQGDVNVRLFERTGQSGLTWAPPSVDKTRLVHGDPIIEITGKPVPSSIQQEIDSSNIVEEMMMLACQSAASWCAERNIPVMYRGSVETPVAGELSLEQLQQQVVFPHLEKHGQLSRTLGFRYIRVLGRAIAHSSPIPHKIIGAKSYLKVTSPLRRFSDMIAHWQIEAALRYEASTGKMFDANTTDRSVLAFSKGQIQESIVTLSPREKIIRKTMTNSLHFWIAQALMRAYYYKETPLPATMKLSIRSTALGETSLAHGFLSEYSINVRVMPIEGKELMVGDEWEAEIYAVNVFQRAIYMRPISLLQRESDVE